MSYLKWFIYFISEVLQNMRDNLGTTIVTIVTIALSLAICGLFLGFFINLNSMIRNVSGEIHVVAYIKDGLPDDTVMSIRKKIINMPEVEALEFISKEAAFAIFKDDLKGQDAILEGLSTNPFPASLEIRIKESFRNSHGIVALVSRLRAVDGIEDVQYGQEWVNRFFAFIRFIEICALIIGGFILVAATFIVANTIRLAVYARREEIEILGLLGATNAFIKIPFFIESILEGILGAVLAIAILYLGSSLLILNTPPIFAPLVIMPFSTLSFSALVISAGIILGLVGSGISLKRNLLVWD